MPEPKKISPLLDNMILGDAISEHNGIRCYPVMHTQTNEKFILKVISIPSSKTKLEALLLTGALENEEAAKAYFLQRAKELTEELDALNQLSRQEGFLCCEGYQIVSAEDSIGYEIYILNRYKRTLERYMAKHTLTQLDALNLGLDLCSALTACRRSGYLFVNLKPSNIYINDNGEYKISDLGFVPLNTLKYAVMPEQYIGSYTAPEIEDAFASLNETLDVYAVGMILYMIYNGGVLPEIKNQDLSAPAYADSALSEIILKACSPCMEDRWQDPAQMGQMLVSYMQKNGAFDTPVIPVPEETEQTEYPQITEFSDNSNYENISIDEMMQIIDTIEKPKPEVSTEDISPVEITDAETAVAAEESYTDEKVDMEIPPAVEPEEFDSSDSQPDKDFYEGVSEEVSQILTQADTLAQIDAPELVISPEPEDIILPEITEDGPEITEEDLPAEENKEDNDMKKDDYFNEEYFSEEAPKKSSHWIRNTVIIILLLLLLGGGVLVYTLYVSKSVQQLQVTGVGDELTVSVQSDADESLLSVSCVNTDTHVVITVPVSGGKAQFTGLSASSKYIISVNISGLHILTGNTETEYATPAETSIVQYDVEIGESAGTVKIKFAVNGPDSERWNFTYFSDGEQPITKPVTGHSFTLSGLKENQKYTGILEPEKNLMIKEPLEITFTASELIRANNLKIVSCFRGSLSAQWEAPESIAVESWFARCYNENYDQTVNVKNTTATFNGLNSDEGFTVEVWAQGQTAKQTKIVGENSITVQSFSAELADADTIELSWESTTQPQGGWVVSYWVNDSQTAFEYTTTSQKAVIAPVAPGCKYTFVVSAADSSISTFCQEQICMVPAAEEDFILSVNNKEITQNDLQVSMCKRPATGNWTVSDVPDSYYTQSFSSGEKAALVIFLKTKYEEANNDVDVTMVIKSEENDLVDISASTVSWNSIWNQNYYTLNIPSTPTEPGCYQLSLYWNNMLLFETDFSVS